MRDRIRFASLLASIGFVAILAYAFVSWASGNSLVAFAASIATAWLSMQLLHRRYENLAKRGFRQAIQEAASTTQHAVIVEIPLSDAEFGNPEERSRIHQLAHNIEAAVSRAQVGEYDGDEFGAGVCRLFLYGRECQPLAAVVQSVLAAHSTFLGASIIQRYGGPGAREVRTSAPAV